MKLTKGNINQKYNVVEIKTNDQEMDDFLRTLGCFPGEEILIISKLSSSYIICIKDARYSIDETLAKCIEVN